MASSEEDQDRMDMDGKTACETLTAKYVKNVRKMGGGRLDVFSFFFLADFGHLSFSATLFVDECNTIS